MSSDGDVLTVISDLYTDYYCQLAASVIFIYDTFITFDREVAFFWRGKASGASLLFFANKWISMTAYVMYLVEFAQFPSDKIAGEAMGILQLIPVAVFSALRAYVLSRSKALGLLVGALSMAPVGLNLVNYGYQITGENFPPFGCLEDDALSDALRLRFALFNLIALLGTYNRSWNRLLVASRASIILADTLLIYITWTKLSGSAALADIRQSKRLSLSDILFRGGVTYFVMLFLLNVLHLSLSVTAVATDTEEASFVSIFTSPITSILISRFLLDLQAVNQTVVRLDPDDPLHTSGNLYDSTPSFISSLGGFINPALEAGDDEDGSETQVCSLSEAHGEEESGVQAAASSSSPSTV